jgi:hypothetical protein
MRRSTTAALALTAALTGCGGGQSATKFEDVRPCLDRLALVAANEFTGTLTTPTGGVTTVAPPSGVAVVDWSVDLAYRNPARGANAAHLSFYPGAAGANEELKRAHAAAASPTAEGTLNPNFRRMLAKAEVVSDSIVLTWSSQPTKQQKRRLRACFE